MGRRRWQLVGSPTSPTSPTGPTSPTSPRRRCHAGREQSYTPPIPPACFGGLPSDGMEQFAGDDDDDCSVRTLSTLHDFWALVRKKRDARVCVCWCLCVYCYRTPSSNSFTLAAAPCRLLAGHSSHPRRDDEQGGGRDEVRGGRIAVLAPPLILRDENRTRTRARLRGCHPGRRACGVHD